GVPVERDGKRSYPAPNEAVQVELHAILKANPPPVSWHYVSFALTFENHSTFHRARESGRGRTWLPQRLRTTSAAGQWPPVRRTNHGHAGSGSRGRLRAPPPRQFEHVGFPLRDLSGGCGCALVIRG